MANISDIIVPQKDTPITPHNNGTNNHESDNKESNDSSSQAAPAKRILCIEDEHFIGELYMRALAKAGYDVTLEYDGAKGLAAAQTDQFDIILLDIMVPSLKGTEILHRLRDPKETPKLHARIIITTNLDQSDENRALIEKQADGYIIKADVTPKELVAFLDKLH